jgi:ectoine hydroxylase-related dioxygenase (phytanoyl-CoA dioxygenase family)
MTIDVDHYHREGWCLVTSLIDEDSCQRLVDATERLERNAAELMADTVMAGVFFEVQSASGRKKEAAVAPGALRKITSPSRGEASFLDLRSDRRVLATAHACGIGAPQCVVDQINFKHPVVGTGFPFHQDASFIHGDAKIQFQRHGGINMVIALDSADSGNGGFTVLGQTHRDGLVPLPHGYDTSRLNEGVFNEQHRCVPAMQPGDAVLFHPLLAHGSGCNSSDRRRRLITLWLVGKSSAP